MSERLGQATGVTRFVTSSNEAFAAHFSMYGVLADAVPPKFGYSLYALVCSVIPRVLWPDRPLDIYFYYSDRWAQFRTRAIRCTTPPAGI